MHIRYLPIKVGKFLIALSFASCIFPDFVQANQDGLNQNTSLSSTVSNSASNAYILGPGDSLLVELLEIPELSGVYSIGPDGSMYLPRLRALHVDGLTISEFAYFLTEQYKKFVKNPNVFVSPITYRSVRVYVGGEIARPGYYTLAGEQSLVDNFNIDSKGPSSRTRVNPQSEIAQDLSDDVARLKVADDSAKTSIRWPTLFDALRAANGVTPFSDLSKVNITRKQPLGSGGGKVKAQVNFLRLVSYGDEQVNVRLFDGDYIHVEKSDIVMRDQLLAASRTNLSPDFINVFVSGRVKVPGSQYLRQGASLNQAIATAGGAKLLRGRIEFVRFNVDGGTDRRKFSYNPSAATGEYSNPVLMNGDLVRINDSVFSAGVEVLNEITGPAVGIYSVYSLFKP